MDHVPRVTGVPVRGLPCDVARAERVYAEGVPSVAARQWMNGYATGFTIRAATGGKMPTRRVTFGALK